MSGYRPRMTNPSNEEPGGFAPEPSTDEADETVVEDEPGAIGDRQLPDDLRPTDDNPLAKPLPDGEQVDLGVPEHGAGPEDESEDD